jgi:hypothetical protein
MSLASRSRRCVAGLALACAAIFTTAFSVLALDDVDVAAGPLREHPADSERYRKEGLQVCVAYGPLAGLDCIEKCEDGTATKILLIDARTGASELFDCETLVGSRLQL